MKKIFEQKNYVALIVSIFLLAFLLIGCRKEPKKIARATPTIAPTVTATPQPAATVEMPPDIRTGETKISFAVPPSATETHNVQFTTQGLTIGNGAAAAIFLSDKIAVSVADPAPFLALSAQWSAVTSRTTKLTVSVRAERADKTWSEWQLSSLDGDPRTHTGLFFFPRDCQFMQYKIAMERDEKKQAPFLHEINFRFISPGATPKAERAAMLQNISADSIKIISRNNWHCPAANQPLRGITQRNGISHLIVHHTATSNEPNDWPAIVRCIWNFHVATNGWSDTGYHFLVDPDGVVYEGRAGGEQMAGSHFSCANSGTVGIAMLGNFTAQPPTNAALQSLKLLLARECDRLKINPVGNTFHPSTNLNLPTISGHREANNSKAASVCAGTHCPGDTFYPMIPALRKDVQQVLMGMSH